MPSNLRVLLAASGLCASMLLAAPGASAAAAPASVYGPYTQEQMVKEMAGLWSNMNSISVEKYETIPQPLTPKYQAMKEQQTRNRAEGKQIFTASAQCMPSGMPRMMLAGSFEVLVRPDSLGLVSSGGGIQIRNIWLDGRKHTPEEDLFDSFSGESIGHWEGDTLVVDTIGLRPSNELLYGVQGPNMKVSERMRKVEPDILEVVLTVTNPEIFTSPWVTTLRFKRNLKRGLNEENYCVAALDREVDKDGKEIFDLTPPPDPLAKN